MDNIQIKNKLILWTINDNKWLLGYDELTSTFILKKHPFTGHKLTKITLDKLKAIIKEIGGKWWFSKLTSIKNFKKMQVSDLQNLKKDSTKLGNGRYATVYLYNGYAIKMINHQFYKNLPRIDGSFEAKILKLLQEKITFNYYTPNIITSYQYLTLKKVDYIVLEKLDKTFWDYLQNKPNNKIIKAIILQILFTLVVLQHVFSNFRHNDLKVDNILLDFTPRTQHITLQYKNNNWLLQKNIPIVKIADFDYANIPIIADNSKVTTKHSSSFGCTSNKSDIYDLHLFLNSLYSYKNNYNNEIVKWIEKQIPENCRGNDNNNIKYGRLKNPEKMENVINSPLKLLKSNFFGEFQIDKCVEPCWGIE